MSYTGKLLVGKQFSIKCYNLIIKAATFMLTVKFKSLFDSNGILMEAFAVSLETSAHASFISQ